MTAQQSAELIADGLLTIAAAAAFLSVSRSTIYVLMEQGTLPSVRIGRARRIPRRSLITYAAAHLGNGADGP